MSKSSNDMTSDPSVSEPNTAQSGVPQSERVQARRENWRLVRRRPSFIIGSIIVAFWVVCAVLGTRITPHDPNNFRTKVNLRPSWKFPMGTDKGGRDVLSRVMMGARDILKVAPVIALLSVVAGVILGLCMGYFRGWFDLVMGRIVEAFLAIPVILLSFVAVTTLGRSTIVVIFVVAALFTPIVARTVRSAVLGEVDLDYVTSARLRGESGAFIMFREILPNVLAPIIVELTIRIGYAVFSVATLTFIGAGPRPPSPDWGAQVSLNYTLLNNNVWWSTLYPALAIASLVIAINLIADAVQSVVEA
jgi:peptide/nickel transport system permease protein